MTGVRTNRRTVAVRLTSEPPLGATPALRTVAGRRLRAWSLAVCVLAGMIAAWNARHSMNPDGISYLDLADAFRHGNWRDALNAYWSPLYPAALAAVLGVLRPTPYWEFTACHVANFLAYLLALAWFDRFVRSLVVRRASAESNAHDGWPPEEALLVFGYSTFLWSSLSLVTLRVVTPDLLVAAFVYCAATLVLRRTTDSESPRSDVSSLALGVTLGLGYLAKAAMFPISLVLLACQWALAPRGWPQRRVVVISLLAFGMVASLLVVPLSMQKHRLTSGDAGKLNFAWFVGGGRPYVHWQGDTPEGTGVATHPTRLVSRRPATYEFATPLPGTYPPWFDPSYWNEGIAPRPRWAAQWAVLGNSLRNLYGVARQAWPLVAVLLFLLWQTDRRARRTEALRCVAVLVLISVLAITMYAVIIIVTRHIAPFVTLIIVCGPALLPGRTDRTSSRTRRMALATGAAVMTVITLSALARETAESVRETAQGKSHPSFAIARELQRRGIDPGSRVGIVGEGLNAFWARAARTRVVVETPDAAEFWAATDEDRSRCIEEHRRAGAIAIVTDRVPDRLPAGWERLGSTGHAVLAPPLDPMHPPF